MSVRIICSGLGSFAPCSKREACANYVHWIDDPRSEFRSCSAGKFEKFTERGDAAAAPKTIQQLEMFA